MNTLAPTFTFFRNTHVYKIPNNISEPEMKTKIIEVVENVTGIKWDKINVESRKKELVFARQLLFYLFYNYTTKSLNSISDLFNKKYNHATIIYGRDCIQEDLECIGNENRKKLAQLAISKFNKKIIRNGNNRSNSQNLSD